MNVKAMITIGVLGGFTVANAQSIDLEVIATAGEHFQNGSSQLSWTMGESITDTYSAGGNIVTQGFHQTQLMVTSVEESNLLNLDVNIFPNPTSDHLIVDAKGEHSKLTITLYDVNGKMIMQSDMKPGQGRVKLNLSELVMAYYMLGVVDESGNYSSSHKIIKTGIKNNH